MPAYRKLYTKIVDSFDFADMPDDLTRLIWVLMIVVVDSQGRGIDSPSWINSRMFPLSPHSLDDIDNSMSWLNERGMIRQYTVNGRRYFDIPKFHDYQTGTDKEAASVLPPHPQVQSYSEVTPELVKSRFDTIVSVSDSVSESESVSDNGRNIFNLFEENIGVLTPMLSEELRAAEAEYSQDWIESAIREAVRNGKRNWSYVRAILKNWKAKGQKDTRGKAEIPVEPYASEVYG